MAGVVSCSKITFLIAKTLNVDLCLAAEMDLHWHSEPDYTQ